MNVSNAYRLVVITGEQHSLTREAVVGVGGVEMSFIQIVNQLNKQQSIIEKLTRDKSELTELACFEVDD